MGDRRIGDRRKPEVGVIKIKFKDAVIYLIIAFVLIISISANIVLGIQYNRYKKAYDELSTSYDESAYDESLDEEPSYDELY